jgi:hypothetical protein
VSYVVGSGDLRLSLPWVLAFPAISFSVAWLFVSLNLSSRFPSLNRYLLFGRGQSGSAQVLTESEWALAQATYLESGLRGLAVLSAPLEDGLICVPLLLVGVGPVSATVGGIVFGAAHLARFTYIECIGKALYYMLVCYFILPHGLLTVATGHLLTDIIGLVGIKIGKHSLSRESRSNPAVKGTLRDEAAQRPLP